MKKNTTPIRATPTRRQALLALLGTALLPGCGGGTDVAGVSSGGTGSFTSGTITGLGSIIVNGIRYDDRTATVTMNGMPSTAEALQLGMVVRIQGSAITAPSSVGALATATATSIAYGSEWKGQAATVDVAAGTFKLLGQTVRVLGSTVFSQGKFEEDLNGRYVEVYGFVDARDGSLQASRIEVESSAPNQYRLSGIVSGLSATTFRLGSAEINHASASKPTNLANGQLVRAELQTTQQNGAWVATEIKADDYRDELDDDDEARIEGAITSFTSSTSFSVNGMPVDASRITPPPGLALGVRVEVRGAISAGVVIATDIDIEFDDEIESQAFKLYGMVSALDTVAQTFVIRGYTVRYDGQTVFDLGTADWEKDLPVEVRAEQDSSGAWLAIEIKVDD